MRTGVTHQLRVHLAAVGHPVLGDRRYGPAGADAPWHHLHALAVTDDDDALPELRAPFPEHWRALCERLGWPTTL
jgi:23S rRNA-/tRNA-specific pseudouridylate synthase